VSGGGTIGPGLDTVSRGSVAIVQTSFTVLRIRFLPKNGIRAKSLTMSGGGGGGASPGGGGASSGASGAGAGAVSGKDSED